MAVFDFKNTPEDKAKAVCTYTTFQSGEANPSPEKPIMLIDNRQQQWKHHSTGVFTNPIKRTAFEFKEESGVMSADILQIDARFVSLLQWLGENHINVRLSGDNRPDGYAVYKISEIAYGGGTKLSSENGFLQFMIERLLASAAPGDISEDEALQKHAPWLAELKKVYTFTAENAMQILLKETGKVFAAVLEDAGVYKNTCEGREAFVRFVEHVNQK